MDVLVSWEDPITRALDDYVGPLPVTLGKSDDNDIILPSIYTSRQHARIEPGVGDSVRVVDLNSKNGIRVDGKKVPSAVLNTGDIFSIGPFILAVTILHDDDETQAFDRAYQSDIIPVDNLEAEQPEELTGPESDYRDTLVIELPTVRPAFPPQAFDDQLVSINDIRQSGLPVEETTYLALGGGIGSFIWVDTLLIHGVNASLITALGIDSIPYGKYKRFCVNSQIPAHERLRSDSGSTPDNLWGFPGYALRELYHCLRQGDWRQLRKILWRISAEPTFAESYTPLSGNVYASLNREMDRIGWQNMWRYGSIRAIRKTDDGRYVVAYSQSRKNPDNPHHLMIADYLHIALGYPAIRLLPDLTDYRVRTGDFKQVVNAYEPHDHIYDHLQKQGGTVLIRGRGIVASRIIQRIHEVRQYNPDVGIVHLMRTPIFDGAKYGLSRRLVENHWELQPYSWPKSAMGGIHRDLLANASPEERVAFLNDWGGTTTADRRAWREIIECGLKDGWYRIDFGQVEHVDNDADGQVVSYIQGRASQPSTVIRTDFIIDATGLEAGLDANPVLEDVVAHYDLPRNPNGRLNVNNQFELAELRNQNGRVYAAGIMTLGEPYAAVDSFTGLQYAALRSAEDLIEAGAPGIQPLTPLRSLRQWLRWARGVHP